MAFGTQDEPDEVMNEINMTPLVDVMLVLLSVDAKGNYYWNENRVDDSSLPALLQAEAARTPQPDLHIRGDREVRYERVAQAMAAAEQAGLKKIGFITEPRH